jgi:hypothetical protein
MQTQQRKYQRNESLCWQNVEGNSVTRRMVNFVSYAVGGERAIVEFGHSAEGVARRHDVPVAALSRVETQHQPPIFHQDFIRPRAAPTPLSETQIARRLAERRTVLADAHSRAAQAREGVTSTSELVTRARREHEAARAALLSYDQHLRAEAQRYESWVRSPNGETPPEPQPSGQDRGYIVARVAMTESVHTKLEGEARDAQARLGEAMAGVRQAAAEWIAARFESDVEQLRELEDVALRFRADLVKISQNWFGGSALKLSEASANLLGTIPDFDRLKFMGRESMVTQWQSLYEQLIKDPAADFAPPEPVTEQAA